MRTPVLAAVFAASTLLTPSVARAGACREAWVNNAYRDLNLGQPNGNDNHGECNIKLYGNGSWSSYEDLKSKVKTYRGTYFANGQCRDSFIAQAYTKALGRLPNGKSENDECDMYNYGNGSWSGLDDLVAKVKTFKGVSSAPPSLEGLHLNPSGDVLNAQSVVIARSADVRGRIIGDNGGGLIDKAGGTLMTGDGASLVRLGATALARTYTISSTSDGKTILGTCTLRDGRKVTVYKK